MPQRRRSTYENSDKNRPVHQKCISLFVLFDDFIVDDEGYGEKGALVVKSGDKYEFTFDYKYYNEEKRCFTFPVKNPNVQ